MPTRRQLIAGAAASSVGLLLWGRRDQALQRQKNDHESPPNAEIVGLLQHHPAAKVHIYQDPRDDDASLIIAVQENGGVLAETIWHMRDTGWIERRREERRKQPAAFSEGEEDSDVFPTTASGFMTEHDGNAYIVSNRHVLMGAAKPFEELMTMDDHRDIGVSPGEITARCEGDQYDLPFVPVSKALKSTDLPQRKIRIRGMGSQLYEIEGKPVLIDRCINGNPKCADCAGKLALVINAQDMQQEDLIGMSGSRVEDIETGDIVGTFDSAPSVSGLQGRFLMLFSGPEDLRSNLAQATLKRTRDQARYDLGGLMQPAAGLVPPSPEP